MEKFKLQKAQFAGMLTGNGGGGSRRYDAGATGPSGFAALPPSTVGAGGDCVVVSGGRNDRRGGHSHFTACRRHRHVPRRPQAGHRFPQHADIIRVLGCIDFALPHEIVDDRVGREIEADGKRADEADDEIDPPNDQPCRGGFGALKVIVIRDVAIFASGSTGSPTRSAAKHAPPVICPLEKIGQ